MFSEFVTDMKKELDKTSEYMKNNKLSNKQASDFLCAQFAYVVLAVEELDKRLEKIEEN